MHECNNQPPVRGHDEILEAVVMHLLTEYGHGLDEVCTRIGMPVLRDGTAQPVHVTDISSYREAMVLSAHHGVTVSLSDGSQIDLKIIIRKWPHQDVEVPR